MPRSLTRLRYRAPPKRISFQPRAAARPRGEAHLAKHIAKYVIRQSNPRHVKLQIVVNPKSRPQPTGQFVPAPVKPFTLRDVVDPEGTSKHGQIIYVFRNVKSNQVIYSLQEMLDDHHLGQLPFIGKHSKPPVLRPDEWTPHCVITFPTAEQGHNAFRKLREFRKLHELAWDKNNPGWKQAPIKQRIKKIMDQRANTSADLAEVLRIQEEHGGKMAEALEEQQKEAIKFMDAKWAEIDALANAAAAKDKEADNIEWLENQVRSLTMQLKKKKNQNEADQRRLTNAKIIQEIRLRKIQYAHRKAEQFKQIQEKLQQKATPANEFGAEGKLDEFRKQVQVLKQSIEDPDPTRLDEDLKMDSKLLVDLQSKIAALEEAFEAKTQFDARDHHIARSVLPTKLKKTLPTPYTLQNVRIRWADMQDALYASGSWPEIIEHEQLAMNTARANTHFLSAENYAASLDHEVGQVMQALGYGASEEGSVAPEIMQSSVLAMLPQGNNAFSRATS